MRLPALLITCAVLGVVTPGCALDPLSDLNETTTPATPDAGERRTPPAILHDPAWPDTPQLPPRFGRSRSR